MGLVIAYLMMGMLYGMNGSKAVSYTPMTLPTTRELWIARDFGSSNNKKINREVSLSMWNSDMKSISRSR